MSLGFGKAYAFDDDLKPAEVYHFTYNSEEGRRMIQSAATSLGMKEKWPATALVALAFTIIGGLGAIVTLVVLGIVHRSQ